ncbi:MULTISPECIES: GNAT family N-acetyltransferase [unclassified Vibrio]|uniref:GNAT family N-acetyltransferase n=1 Tax=unclassified Vibrio TaxID=2614977 RepID=UPI001361AB0C|nr:MULTISPECIES: GNAT family N-acetyltransferase [unclassified Vibrio]NAW57845.1 GNAT family N-acetyltransferase [Vibrio sp. V36_P2S2PM302]NAX28385.1 GNAT family N-acetyltransferase [Vibrio sp. V38_P2S17PM301]NAX30135.1 GNAT family N-acetyltransferase [Vibrio sp. V37_P2S8PM304]
MTGNATQSLNTLPAGQSVSQQGDMCCVELGLGKLLVSKEVDGFWQVKQLSVAGEDTLRALALAFEHTAEIRCLDVGDVTVPELEPLLYVSEQGLRLLWREALMQQPQLWLKQADVQPYPHKQVLTKAGYHPMRAKAKQGEVYRRYIPQLEQTLTLVGLDVETHLPFFHRWQNSERVAAFWEQTGTLEEHKTYLQEQVTNNKNQLLVVCLNNEPFAYIEAYWTKEDRIGPYYHAGDYDRGIHMLVGEEHHRGAHKVAAWLPSVCHFLYLSDPRTEKIVSEPRADNGKMIGYLQKHGFAKVKEFDFPHKRAALMCQLRDTFFSDHF